MFRYTDDPVADAEAYYNELARLEEKLPVCCDCKSPVMEDFCFDLNDGRIICAECLDKRHKKTNTNVFDLECDHCGEYLDDEHYYRNTDGEVFCTKCVYKHYKKEVIVE